jgi:hypothetical protein
MDLGERISPSSTSDLQNALFSVEPLSDARTPLADFFSILLEARHVCFPQGRLYHRLCQVVGEPVVQRPEYCSESGSEIDYAVLMKIYGPAPEQHRYSPPQCIGIRSDMVRGNPDPAHISTSYIERQNLTMRMQMRRFTRLTNAFSKKIENHAAAIALHYMAYNFVKIHKTLRVTPAMAAGVTDHVWELEEIVELLEVQETASQLAN